MQEILERQAKAEQRQSSAGAMPQAEAWRQARPRPAVSSSSRRRGGFDLAALLQHLEQNPPGGSPWVTLGAAALLWCGAVLLACRLLDVIS